jgi:radical SAM superfamily enzyme YgiQ (UPF0313 family)
MENQMSVSQPPYDVWLCDLTHTQQTIASNTIPLPIGLIAAYAKKHLGDSINIKLFKFPEKLIESFLVKPPQIIAFSNYAWNFNLGYTMASHIKKLKPEIVVVFGGPNYPKKVDDQESFLKEKNNIDFYIYREGEPGFLALLEALIAHNFNIDKVKQAELPGCHFINNGEFHARNGKERMDFSEVPSPYTTGLFEEFFDGQLVPLIQTNRGCPFSCFYCVEGDNYFNKISFRKPEDVIDEVEYIAQHIKGNKYINMADSNFGMYKQDLVIAAGIARIKEKYGFPDYIYGATGKNAKDRVLEAARLSGGLIRFSASVQSTDPEVLKNVKRQNMSLETIIEMGKTAAEIGSNSYSEIILGLPGDSKRAHFKSIEDVINANLTFVNVYTLMLLKGTGIASEEARSQYGFSSHFRVIPRCFGVYDFGGTKLLSMETEEVAVSSNTLSLEDYLECRLFAFTITTFYNDGIMSELYAYLDQYGIKPYEFLKKIHDQRGELPQLLSEAYKEFLRETREELWDTEEKLLKYAKNEEVIKKYIDGEFGSNLIFKYKALAFVKFMDEIHEVALRAAKDIIRAKHVPDEEEALAFLDELIKYNLYKKMNLFETDLIYEDVFHYDFFAAEAVNFAGKPADWQSKQPITYKFFHDSKQKETINFHRQEFDMSVIGISRILTRLHIKKMYRNVTAIK